MPTVSRANPCWTVKEVGDKRISRILISRLHGWRDGTYCKPAPAFLPHTGSVGVTVIPAEVPGSSGEQSPILTERPTKPEQHMDNFTTAWLEPRYRPATARA